MNRTEALLMLGLNDSANDQQLKRALDEKIAYHESLSNNSHSAFLRRLNTQQLTKLLSVKKDILDLLKKPLIIHSVNHDIADKLDEDGIAMITPVVSSSFAKLAPLKPKANEPVAYLITHTENQSLKPYPLFNGKNFIGRKIHPSLKPFIALENDEFVSRIHAVIYIEQKEELTIEIDDSSFSNEGKPSKNGTFINGNKKRILKRERLKENDTIQIGETKLIFRINTKNINEIVDEVGEINYMHTVVIRL